MTKMLQQAIPLLEVCRTHCVIQPESAPYTARTAAICESLVESIKAELPEPEAYQLHPEAFIVSRTLLEALMAADKGHGLGGKTQCSAAYHEAKNLIYGSAAINADRVQACLKACEGVPTEWLKDQPDEANIRLRGERERRLREEKAAPASEEGAGKVAVDAKALHAVLSALIGPAHLIRELQATREPEELFADNPINVLIKQYNAAVS
jgi:hypothetical protein